MPIESPFQEWLSSYIVLAKYLCQEDISGVFQKVKWLKCCHERDENMINVCLMYDEIMA